MPLQYFGTRGFYVNSMVCYPSSVQLPEKVISPETIHKNSTPYSYPGKDMPCGPMTIVFVNAVDPQEVGDVKPSAIYDFLAAWMSAARMGRGSVSTEANPGVPVYSVDVEYKFDIVIRMLCGPQDQVQDIQMMDGAGSVDAGGLEVASAYIAKNAWVGSLKLDTLDYSMAKVHTISATFYVEDILPYPGIGRPMLKPPTKPMLWTGADPSRSSLSVA